MANVLQMFISVCVVLTVLVLLSLYNGEFLNISGKLPDWHLFTKENKNVILTI